MTKLILSFFILAISVGHCKKSKGNIPHLFTKTTKNGTVKLSNDTIVVSAINATLNSGLLDSSSTLFKIPLPFDKEVVAERTKLVTSGNSTFWIGRSVGNEKNSVLLTLTDNVLSGRMIIDNRLYRITYTGDDIYNIAEISFNEMIDADDDAKLPSEYDTSHYINRSHLATSDQIDVMVLYTGQAESGAGGKAGMNSMINQSVNLTNLSYQLSGITQRIKVVYSDKIAFTESGAAAKDVAALQTNAGVRALRNTYNADIVVLITETADAGKCGQAFAILDPATSSFENKAFAVVKRECAADNLTFAHELGHLMGGRHSDDTNTTPYPYCHGHSDGSFKTVMSREGNTVRTTNFSNPSVDFDGGGATGVPGVSENYKVFNQTAAVVANFR